MIIANPFTGQVLNANPEGHNQYFNPDGPSPFKKSWVSPKGGRPILVPSGGTHASTPEGQHNIDSEGDPIQDMFDSGYIRMSSSPEITALEFRDYSPGEIISLIEKGVIPRSRKYVIDSEDYMGEVSLSDLFRKFSW
jgi:hypothetical protein